MDQLRDLVGGTTIEPTAVLDIALTALLIYGLFSLIQGTRAVRLVIGAIVLYAVYAVAQLLDLRLLSGILETGAVVGLLALVVIFQPELRRALERIGRVGSMGWAFSASGADGQAERLARTIARTAAGLATRRVGALVVIERDTGLEDAAETGVMLHADLSEELLDSIFMPRGALHDGAVIVRGDRILAAGAVLPLSEISVQQQRYGTRHRAAIGITEQTDAVVVVVSEETGGMSLVERGRVIRDLDEERLRTGLVALLRPTGGAHRAAAGISALGAPFARGKRPRVLRRRSDRRPTNSPAAAAAPAQATTSGAPATTSGAPAPVMAAGTASAPTVATPGAASPPSGVPPGDPVVPPT
ncbi:MAG: diadenylate cyclase CdaA [Chloroflexi bacterium]|nr:diadenylate cyclase CdaA [Chloroflexota bacterium]